MVRSGLRGAGFLLVAACAGCGGGGGDPVCGTGTGELPEGLEVLSWDGGGAGRSMRGQGFAVTVFGQTFELDEEPLWEGVRFDLDRPARIHGFEVQWANLDGAIGASAEIEAGLYPDFGHNGFDFWREAYWSGTRCAGDIVEGETATYVLEAPVEISQPGLVYVGHYAAAPEDPTFAFDLDVTGEGTCALWDECHSAVNMPEAWDQVFFNGVTLSFPYDYIVRLHVEYTDEVLPEERIFQPAADLPLGLRMAWGDYDNDGWDDLVTSGPDLYRNEGDGTFTLVTGSSGIAAMGITGSGSWGDYDNDGCLDLFVVADLLTESNSLLHSNCDGTFSDVTAAAGVSGLLPNDVCGNPALAYPQSQAAAWADLDGDGYLDVYVANYNCGFDAPDFVDNVYRNNADGTFTEWTGTRGFLPTALPGRGAAPLDYDGDGDVDLYVHDYFLKPNLFFQNAGDGTFLEIAESNDLDGVPAIFQGDSLYGHSLGAAWGDLDGDGDFDLIEANLAHPRLFHLSNKTRVMMNDGTGMFFDGSGDWSVPASAAGLRYSETHTSPSLADFDQDGALDLVISARYDGRPTDFYWGDGDGTFTLDVLHAGITAEDGWGTAVADFDHDGDLDLATSDGLFRNTLQDGTGHWLQVRAVGNVASNRAAIGATVRVTAGGQTFLRYVQGNSGSGCQDSANLHFGIGDAATIDSIEVTYIGGGTVTYAGPFAADQRLWVYEDGSVLTGWSNPT